MGTAWGKQHAAYTVGFEYEIDSWKIEPKGRFDSKVLLQAFDTVEGAELLKLEPDGDHAEIISNALLSIDDIEAAINGMPAFAAEVRDGKTHTVASGSGAWSIQQAGHERKERSGAVPSGAVHVTVAVPLAQIPRLFRCPDPRIEHAVKLLDAIDGEVDALPAGSAERGLCYLADYYMAALNETSIVNRDGPKHTLSLMSRFDFHTMYSSLDVGAQGRVQAWMGLDRNWQTKRPATVDEVAALFPDLGIAWRSPICFAGFHTGVWEIPPLLCPPRFLWLYSIVAPEPAFAVFARMIQGIFDGLRANQLRLPCGWTYVAKNRWFHLAAARVVDFGAEGFWAEKRGPTGWEDVEHLTWQAVNLEYRRVEQVLSSLRKHAAGREATYLVEQHVKNKDLCSPPPWYEHSDSLPYAMGCYPKVAAGGIAATPPPLACTPSRSAASA